MAAHSHDRHAHGGGDYHGDAARIDNPDVRHETDDINVRAILWFVVVLSVVAVVIHVAMWGMFKGLAWYERKNEPYVTPLVEAAGRKPPDPQLQTTPWTDLRVFETEQRNYLRSYGWVDEKLGVARIPIAKAKEMMLQRGVPVRPELAQDLDGTHVFATGDSSGGRTIAAGGADKSSADAGAPSGAPAGATATPTPAPGKPGGGGQ